MPGDPVALVLRFVVDEKANEVLSYQWGPGCQSTMQCLVSVGGTVEGTLAIPVLNTEMVGK